MCVCVVSVDAHVLSKRGPLAFVSRQIATNFLRATRKKGRAEDFSSQRSARHTLLTTTTTHHNHHHYQRRSTMAARRIPTSTTVFVGTMTRAQPYSLLRSPPALFALLSSLLLIMSALPYCQGQQQQDPTQLNGGSVLAMAGDGCVALAVDKRFGSGLQVCTHPFLCKVLCCPCTCTCMRGGYAGERTRQTVDTFVDSSIDLTHRCSAFFCPPRSARRRHDP